LNLWLRAAPEAIPRRSVLDFSAAIRLQTVAAFTGLLQGADILL
jgi:predicted nicotinamide N-methyase